MKNKEAKPNIFKGWWKLLLNIVFKHSKFWKPLKGVDLTRLKEWSLYAFTNGAYIWWNRNDLKKLNDWNETFSTSDCTSKYRNKAVYRVFTTIVKEVKDNIGKYDAKVKGENNILNFQHLYRKFLREKNTEEKNKLLSIALRKFLRFFPIYQNYLNLCGYPSTGRNRCKYYNMWAREAIPAFVEKGYLLRLISILEELIKKMEKLFKQVKQIFATLKADLLNGQCTEDIVEGMKTLYKDLIVDLPFQYAGAKHDADKKLLEYEAANFFTDLYDKGAKVTDLRNLPSYGLGR